MKKFWSMLFAGAMMLALGIGCDKNDDPKPEPDPVDVDFTEYSLEGTSSYWTNLEELDDWEGKLIIIINSDEELSSHIIGEDYPAIDFSQKTLLLSYGVEPYQSAPDETTWQQIAEQHYVMSVNLRPNTAPLYLRWRVAIVVDKLRGESQVELKITRRKEDESRASRSIMD